MTLGKKYKILKHQIIDYLKNKSLHDEVDTTLIDELCYAVFLVDECKKSIKKQGLIVNVSKNPDAPYYQQNAAIGVYNSAVKTITMISTRLSITPADRAKLIDIEAQNKDNFFEENYSD